VPASLTAEPKQMPGIEPSKPPQGGLLFFCELTRRVYYASVAPLVRVFPKYELKASANYLRSSLSSTVLPRLDFVIKPDGCHLDFANAFSRT
jgi:hypothetical protein